MLKPLRASILFFLVTAALAPFALVAQSIVNISPQQCVWRAVATT